MFRLLLSLTLGKCQLRTILNSVAVFRSMDPVTQPAAIGQLI